MQLNDLIATFQQSLHISIRQLEAKFKKEKLGYLNEYFNRRFRMQAS